MRFRTQARPLPPTPNSHVIVDLAMIGTIVFACIPLAFTLNLRLAGIPVLDFFYLAMTAVVTWRYLKHSTGKSSLFALYSAGVFYLATVTFMYIQHPLFDVRWAFQDLCCYCGLPIGIAIVRLKGRDGINALLLHCYTMVSITFALSLLLLVFGFIASAGGENRQLDGAMYTSSFFIAMTLPAVWAASRISKKPRYVVIAGVAMTLFFAVISATRSVLICLLIAVFCTFWIEIKRDSRNLLWVGVASFILLSGAVMGAVPGLASFQGTLLGERLASTDIQSEDRFDELSGMFRQMGTAEWVHGAGMGVGFNSPVPDTGVATTPHIGIVSLLYKGGLLGFLGLMIVPCLIAGIKLFSARNRVKDPFCAAVAIYFITSCLSGGWAFVALLLLGICLEGALSRIKGSRSVIMWRAVSSVTAAGGLSRPDPA